jgi:hypothetical protein
MPKKKKLRLNELTVSSFVTLEEAASQSVKGGVLGQETYPRTCVQECLTFAVSTCAPCLTELTDCVGCSEDGLCLTGYESCAADICAVSGMDDCVIGVVPIAKPF